jgi:hypothetical protein
MHGSYLQLTNILTISTSNCLNDLEGEDSKSYHEVVTRGNIHIVHNEQPFAILFKMVLGLFEPCGCFLL